MIWHNHTYEFSTGIAYPTNPYTSHSIIIHIYDRFTNNNSKIDNYLLKRSRTDSFISSGLIVLKSTWQYPPGFTSR